MSGVQVIPATQVEFGSVPFVTQLRTRKSVVRVGNQDSPHLLHLRVQVAEAWDAVRIDIPSDETIQTLKINALEALAPSVRFHDEYVVKLRGCEIFDEQRTLAQAGVRNGSILLIHFRRRRPVR